MTSTYSKETINDVIHFHGHSCPGLCIGIRAAELARRELGDATAAEMICVTETDMCGVDAIQYLSGCTFGKGNLIHKDYGKMAFSFFNRKTGQGFRCLLKSEARGDMAKEIASLHTKIASGQPSEADKARCDELRLQMQERLMQAELNELFDVMAPNESIPTGARILESLTCETCGEATMESRTRRFAGKTLCKPCFYQVEQKQ